MEYYGKTSIENIPPEVLNIIFKFLDVNSRRISRLVCTSWYHIANLSLALKIVLNDATLQDFRSIKHEYIKELRVSNLQMKMTSCQSTTRSIFANKMVHSLVIGGNRGVSGVSEANIKALLILLKDIATSLAFEHDAFWTLKNGETKFLKNFQMHYLTSLNVNVAPRWFTLVEKLPYSCLFKNFFPSLNTLIFKCDAYNMSMDVIIGLYSFICRHSGTLTSLKVTHTRVYHYTAKEDARVLKSGIYERIRQDILKLRLNILAYDHLTECSPCKGIQWQNMEWDLLHSQKTLKTFHCHVQFPLRCPRYKEILQTNQNSLEDVYILTVSIPEPLFDCKWVENCENLTILNLCIINLGPRETERENYRNITKLPKKLARLTFGSTILNWEVDWIVNNLKLLKEICFCMKWKYYEENSLYQLKKFLRLPYFVSYIVLDYKCPILTQFVNGTPGLKDRNSKFPYYTDVYVDRSVFDQSVLDV